MQADAPPAWSALDAAWMDACAVPAPPATAKQDGPAVAFPYDCLERDSSHDVALGKPRTVAPNSSPVLSHLTPQWSPAVHTPATDYDEDGCGDLSPRLPTQRALPPFVVFSAEGASGEAMQTDGPSPWMRDAFDAVLADAPVRPPVIHPYIARNDVCFGVPEAEGEAGALGGVGAGAWAAGEEVSCSAGAATPMDFQTTVVAPALHEPTWMHFPPSPHPAPRDAHAAGARGGLPGGGDNSFAGAFPSAGGWFHPSNAPGNGSETAEMVAAALTNTRKRVEMAALYRELRQAIPGCPNRATHAQVLRASLAHIKTLRGEGEAIDRFNVNLRAENDALIRASREMLQRVEGHLAQVARGDMQADGALPAHASEDFAALAAPPAPRSYGIGSSLRGGESLVGGGSALKPMSAVVPMPRRRPTGAPAPPTTATLIPPPSPRLTHVALPAELADFGVGPHAAITAGAMGASTPLRTSRRTAPADARRHSLPTAPSNRATALKNARLSVPPAVGASGAGSSSSSSFGPMRSSGLRATAGPQRL